MIEIAEIDVSIEQDDTLIREIETPGLVGSPEKLERATGWQPQISLRDSLGDTFDYWLQRTANEFNQRASR